MLSPSSFTHLIFNAVLMYEEETIYRYYWRRTYCRWISLFPLSSVFSTEHYFFYFKTWCPSRWNEKLIRDVIIQKSRWTGYALVWTDKDCPSQTYCNRLLFHWAICLTVTWLDELSYAGKRTSIVVCCNEWLLLIHVCISKKKKNNKRIHVYLVLGTDRSFRTSWVKQLWYVITICKQVCFLWFIIILTS